MNQKLLKAAFIAVALSLSPPCGLLAANEVGITPLTQTISAQESKKLVEQVESKMAELKKLISKASKKKINTLKEETTLRTAEIFMIYADWDAKNVTKNVATFKKVSIYKKEADYYANLLPDFERNEILLMVNNSIAELTRVLKGEIVRLETPRVDWSKTSIEGDVVMYKGKPVFLADWTWKPSGKMFDEYHGSENGFFLTPSYVIKEDGSLNPHKLKDVQEKGTGTMGAVFMNHTSMPNWAKEKDPKVTQGAGIKYVMYDINSPTSKDVLRKLIAGFAPYMKGQNFSKLGYMLCNEPHWNTIEGSWAANPISDLAVEDFKKWLEVKHKTIENLNRVWGTSYSSFASIDAPNIMRADQQGTPLYFDFMSYNMDRVTDWFSFLASEIKKHDSDAKTHIKLIPELWGAGNRDHGLDFEALTRNSDIIGNDGGSCREPMWGAKPEWSDNFDFNWKSFCMNFDFFKSISPNKAMYNSEGHFLSKIACRDLYLTPQYTRCNYWLAAVHGQDVVQTWYWARKADGSSKGDSGFAGSNNMQPRVVNEVHTTIADLNSVADKIVAYQRQRKAIRIFYSKASSINDKKYMSQLSDIYQAVAFDGVPVGFATEGVITHNDNKSWDVILLYKTPKVFNSDVAKLQEYLNKGGVVVVDNESLKSDEYGQPLTQKLTQGKGKLIVCNSLSQMSSLAFKAVDEAGQMPLISLSQESGLAQKGCIWRVVKGDDGALYLNVANVGKNVAKVSLSLPNSNTPPASVVNGLTMENIGSSFEMKPCDLYFLKIK